LKTTFASLLNRKSASTKGIVRLRVTMKKKAFTRNERLAAIADAALPPPLKML
jgi:hypothetical protein